MFVPQALFQSKPSSLCLFWDPVWIQRRYVAPNWRPAEAGRQKILLHLNLSRLECHDKSGDRRNESSVNILLIKRRGRHDSNYIGSGRRRNERKKSDYVLIVLGSVASGFREKKISNICDSPLPHVTPSITFFPWSTLFSRNWWWNSSDKPWRNLTYQSYDRANSKWIGWAH